MPRGEKDHGTNWLIQNQSLALVRLLGLSAARSCRTAHPRLTLPEAIPDGLLEVSLPGHDDPLPLLVEIETYPSRETDEQMARDLDLAQLALGVLPDAVVIVLRRRGAKQAAGRVQTSSLGWSQRRHRWRVVEMWKLRAEDLLELGDVGLVPLVPLARSRESPAALIRRCRERIEQHGKREQRGTLLTITSIMASLRYTDARELVEILGGQAMLAESPLYQEWIAKTKQADIVSFLAGRFGSVPEELAAQIRSVTDLTKLESAILHASRCKGLEDFRKRFTRS